MVDLRSRETQVLVGGPAVSTSLPGHLRPVPDVARGQPAVPGLSRPVRGMAVSVSGPGRLGPVPEGPQCRQNLPGDSGPGPRSSGRPAVPGDPGPCPRARGVDQVSQVTRAHARSPAVSTRCPGRLRPGSKCLRARPAVPGASGPVPRACEVDRLSRGLGPGSESLRGRPAVPWESGPCPRARGFNQLSRDTRAWVRSPSGSTNCPCRLRLGSDACGVPAVRAPCA